MSRTHSEQVTARVPASLLAAAQARAAELEVHVSDVVRVSLARELATPPDRRSRAFVELWLAGVEPEPPTEEKA